MKKRKKTDREVLKELFPPEIVKGVDAILEEVDNPVERRSNPSGRKTKPWGKKWVEKQKRITE